MKREINYFIEDDVYNIIKSRLSDNHLMPTDYNRISDVLPRIDMLLTKLHGLEACDRAKSVEDSYKRLAEFESEVDELKGAFADHIEKIDRIITDYNVPELSETRKKLNSNRDKANRQIAKLDKIINAARKAKSNISFDNDLETIKDENINIRNSINNIENSLERENLNLARNNPNDNRQSGGF